MPWHWLGSVPQMLQRPDQRRCGKVYDVQDCKAAKPEDGAPAAFVSPSVVSAAESQLIQSRYPHWFEERGGRLCLKLTACRRQAPKRSAEPPIALSVLQQPGESDVDYQQKKSQLIGELSQVINMLATGRQPEGLQLLTLRTASAVYPGDEPNAALCRLVSSLLERMSHAEADAAAADAAVAAPAAAPALGGQVDVLIVACTPAGLQALPEAPLEASAIGELLRASGRSWLCTTLTEGDGGGAAALNALMMRCDPRVVCFIGHGDARFAGDTTLGLANATGALELIPPSTLATVLGEASRRVELVVLNGCSTEKLCEAISTGFGVPAIGWSTVAADVAAKLFSIGIFGCLARRLDETLCGRVVREAFAHGERAIKAASRLVRGANGESIQAWALADPMQPRERSAGEPIPAGLPLLLAPLPEEKLHNVPHLPSHHLAWPGQLNLRDKLLSGRSGGGSMLGIVGEGFATRDASAVAVGIAGSAGLGKSTAAAWLAHDVRVQTAYCDGIFWLTFGQERQALALLNELAEAAGVADGRRERARGDAARVVQLIRERLAKKHCLIVLDDVWRTTQPEPFRRLSEGTTTVLLTTRKRDVTDFFGATLLPLEQMPDEVALELLTNLSGKELRGRTRVSEDELSRLLKLCSGIPAMLRSVGCMCGRMTMRAVLHYFDTHKLKHKVPKGMDAAEGYGNLFMALELQLDALAEADAKNDETLERFCLMTAVFLEDDEVPVNILRVLWDVDEDEALDFAQRLAKEHLIELSEDGETMSLLDVHRDYYACRAKSELAGWHSGLLRRSGVREVGVARANKPAYRDDDYWRSEDGTTRFLHHARKGGQPDNLIADLGCLEALHIWDQLWTLIYEDGDRSCSTPEEQLELDLSLVALGNGLKSNTALTFLDVSGGEYPETMIGDKGIAAIVDGLKFNTCLTTLDTINNEISVIGATALAQALKVNSALTELRLGLNQFANEGAVAIAELLAANTALLNLDVCSNDIGDEGASAIAEALAANTKLAILNLSDGLIGPVGATAIANVLKGNSALTELNLNSNRIGDQGAIAISAALEAITSRLITLDIGVNDIGNEGATALANALKINTVLQTLTFGVKSLSSHRKFDLDEGDVAIAKALQVPLPEVEESEAAEEEWTDEEDEEGGVHMYRVDEKYVLSCSEQPVWYRCN